MSAAAAAVPRFEERFIPELEQTLGTELRLLHLLHEQLLQQREAVARGDAEAINETVHGAGRVLRTLEEARSRRRQLSGLLLGDADAAPADLPAALGRRPDTPLAHAVAELLAYAEVVARAIAVNRRLLNGAVRTDQELVRVLQGEPRGGLVYDREAPVLPRGAVLNRSV